MIADYWLIILRNPALVGCSYELIEYEYVDLQGSPAGVVISPGGAVISLAGALISPGMAICCISTYWL